MCPASDCVHWGRRSANPDDLENGCRLNEECGPICTRDPEYSTAGALATGHTAGFDFFDSRWCSDAERQLPTDATREFWFPQQLDRTRWRKARYQRRKGS